MSIRSVQILNVLRNMHILPDWRGYFVYDIIELHIVKNRRKLQSLYSEYDIKIILVIFSLFLDKNSFKYTIYKNNNLIYYRIFKGGIKL